MQIRFLLLLILISPSVWAESPPVESEAEGRIATSENLTRALITERAAQQARERKVRLAQQHQTGRSSLRPTVRPAATLLNDPAIYRIDYGMRVEWPSVPFLMHADLQPRH